MKISSVFDSTVKIALLGACIYGLVKFDVINLQGDDVADFAEQSCVDEARSRHALAAAKAYSVKENSNGYVVRLTATLSRGGAASVVCLTNELGTVREITIEER